MYPQICKNLEFFQKPIEKLCPCSNPCNLIFGKAFA